ncbi:pH-signaling protein PalC [Talaromyces proteolyticus]|uniref:pH-response regulator protein palC n=1 Tax=Talaromyces proteolyticus TaxID=1131652 RepID=A0AAD4KGS9_9EURO|nr:pH-signaling protein PalC [Talaromyces proteolyticus]KAH8692028.1 pH-signaling protein PalC [Talaromyces proteolyticus]
MVYNFPLPTTSHLAFHNYIYSNTHPSLPQAASTARHSLRIALKTHKRLSPRERENNLQNILNALNEYIPYLFAINDGLSGRSTSTKGGGGEGNEDEGEVVDITLKEEIVVEWRPILSSNLALLKAGGSTGTHAVRGQGIDFEIAFVIGTLGYVLSGLARVIVLRTLYTSLTPTAETRAAAMQNATRLLLQASAAHSLIARSHTSSEATQNIAQLNTGVQTALASLALAEATLLAVLKDDAYTFACIQSRNPDDKEWMVRSPEIPKVRALLFARLCVRGAEYADQAAAGFGSAAGARGGVKIDEELMKYAQTAARAARAKAFRFFGVDAEMAGKTGEGIAWLRAGKGALGVKRAIVQGGEAGKGSTLSKLKKGWTDRRDERKLEKSNSESAVVQGGELGRGDDAGWEEEGRVIEMLETKWVKMNDTVIAQIIPPSEPLLSNLPSGRDIHSPPAPYTPPLLDEDQLIRMRAPPDEAEQQLSSLAIEDDSDEGVASSGERVPGSFPGTRSATADSNYF